MTEQTQAQSAEQTPVFPVPKTLWQEVIGMLSQLPWKLSNPFHVEATKALSNADAAGTTIGVNPDLFNQTVNMLAEQPQGLVAPLLAKVADHVADITAQAKAAAEAQAAAAPVVETAAPALTPAQDPTVVTDVTPVVAAPAAV